MNKHLEDIHKLIETHSSKFLTEKEKKKLKVA